MLSAREAPGRSFTPREPLPSARGRSATPAAPQGGAAREPQHAWLTPREHGAGAGDAGVLKSAGRLAQQRLRRGADPAPAVPASGKTGELGELGVLSRIGLQKDIILPTPRTPEDLGSVRGQHRQRTGPGEASRHWNARDAPVPDPGAGYGVKSFKDDDVAQNFKAGQVVGVAEYMISRGEAIYQSTAREPLGRGWVRGHQMPQETREPEFKGFGFATKYSTSAKESIFPRGQDPESAEAHAQYCRTHGSYGAGEASQRGYRWPKAVAENRHFRFGLENEGDAGGRGAGAKRALDMERGGEPFAAPETNIGTRALQTKRDVANDRLGAGKPSLQGRLPVQPGTAFGLATEKDGLDVGSLLRGFYSKEEQRPDADLGTCLLPGRRNYHSTEPFGVPSVRGDLHHRVPGPDRRSVVNSTNFGDDPDAVDLIFPGKFHHLGLGEQDFCGRREPQELRGILEGAGYRLSDEDFEDVFKEAVGFYGDDHPAASLEAIMVAYFNVTGTPADHRQHHS